MKLFPAKRHERATLRKLWRQTGNSSLLPAKCWPLLHVIRACSWRWPDVVARISPRFSKFAFVLFCFITNHLINDWSLGKQRILFPSNLNVSLDFVSGNTGILGKQNSLFPSGPVIKCLLCSIPVRATDIIYACAFSEQTKNCVVLLNLIYFHVFKFQASNYDMPWSA